MLTLPAMHKGILALGLVAGCSGAAAPASSAESPRSAPVVTPAAASQQTDVGAEPDDVRSGDANAEAPPTTPKPPPDPWLGDLLAAHPDRFGTVLEDPARYRVQILVTAITPAEGGARVIRHGYRVDEEYVYPASAIKTFAAVGALRTLKALRAEGHRVNLDTPMTYCEGPEPNTCHIEQDTSNLAGGTITVGHEIRKMQLVSNNIAFNRLYEVVGHREINESMWALGFPTLRIHHRMYGVKDREVQRTTPRIELHPKRGKKIVVVPHKVSDLDLPATEASSMHIGVGYIDDATDTRVDEALDFSGKNHVSVRDLHRLTLAIVRPELPGVPQLGMAESDRAFLIASMTEDPLESSNPVYTNPHHSGLRYKTMIRGMMRAMPLAKIRYVGKAGRAYGFHLDNAYVEDLRTGRAMVVTVVLYANDNGVLNDNHYEYDAITRPFLKDLGEVLVREVLLSDD